MWEELYLTLLANKSNILIIYYEDLKDTLLRENTLKDIGRFLNFKIDDKRLECVLKHPYSKFKRKKKFCDRNKEKTKNIGIDSDSFDESDSISRQIFEPRHKTLINKAIEKVHNTLVKRFRISSKTINYLKYKNDNYIICILED